MTEVPMDLNQNHTKPGTNLEQLSDLKEPRRTEIRSDDDLALDFRLSLFASALYSMKSTSLLKPYPDGYFDRDSQEIDTAKLVSFF